MNINGSILMLLLVNLTLDNAALLGCSCATNQGGVAIEMLSDFLKRSVASFDVEEPYENKFET